MDEGLLYQRIALTNGGYALVDKEDYEYLNQWEWRRETLGYACRFETIDGKRRLIKMHRVIAQVPEDMCTDHINMDRLENRKENLRVATKSQNSMNTRVRKDSTTGYKGVYKRKSTGMYRVHIAKDGVKRWLGQFPTAQEAARRYNEEAVKLFGEYAKLNIIED